MTGERVIRRLAAILAADVAPSGGRLALLTWQTGDFFSAIGFSGECLVVIRFGEQPRFEAVLARIDAKIGELRSIRTDLAATLRRCRAGS